jgi:hypothetical protein
MVDETSTEKPTTQIDDVFQEVNMILYIRNLK